MLGYAYIYIIFEIFYFLFGLVWFGLKIFKPVTNPIKSGLYFFKPNTYRVKKIRVGSIEKWSVRVGLVGFTKPCTPLIQNNLGKTLTFYYFQDKINTVETVYYLYNIATWVLVSQKIQLKLQSCPSLRNLKLLPYPYLFDAL